MQAASNWLTKAEMRLGTSQSCNPLAQKSNIHPQTPQKSNRTRLFQPKVFFGSHDVIARFDIFGTSRICRSHLIGGWLEADKSLHGQRAMGPEWMRAFLVASWIPRMGNFTFSGLVQDRVGWDLVSRASLSGFRRSREIRQASAEILGDGSGS